MAQLGVDHACFPWIPVATAIRLADGPRSLGFYNGINWASITTLIERMRAI